MLEYLDSLLVTLPLQQCVYVDAGKMDVFSRDLPRVHDLLHLHDGPPPCLRHPHAEVTGRLPECKPVG